MEDFIFPEIITTEDGSSTFIHPLFGDAYHSLRGAVSESEHVFINNGVKLIRKNKIKLLEVGFGSGLNTLLTLKYNAINNLYIEYHTIEKYPVSIDIIKKNRYAELFPEFGEFYYKMHESSWNKKNNITENFMLIKYHKSLQDIEFDTNFDIIYFDAFAPDTQPEMWTNQIFGKLFRHTEINGILTTYSSKGTVKQALRDAGYMVNRLEGALGKRHMLNAIKITDGK